MFVLFTIHCVLIIMGMLFTKTHVKGFLRLFGKKSERYFGFDSSMKRKKNRKTYPLILLLQILIQINFILRTIFSLMLTKVGETPHT